jgi:hypothetical protein
MRFMCHIARLGADPRAGCRAAWAKGQAMEVQPPPDAPPPSANQPHHLAEWWSGLEKPQREGIGLGALLLFAVPLWITLVVAMHPTWQTFQAGFLVFASVAIIAAAIGLTFVLPPTNVGRLVAFGLVLPFLVILGLITAKAIVPTPEDRAPALIGTGVRHVLVYMTKQTPSRQYGKVKAPPTLPGAHANVTPSATTISARQKAAISVHILGFEVKPKPVKGGTVLVTTLSFHNDGPGTIVKHIAATLFETGVPHVDHVRKTAADFAGLSSTPQYDVPGHRDFAVTFDSLVIPPTVFALYQNGSAVYYVDMVFYKKTAKGFEKGPDICAFKPAKAVQFSFCPEASE